MVRWVVGSILHGVEPLSYFSFQPVLHDWCNKGRSMCYPVCGMVHIKEPLLLYMLKNPRNRLRPHFPQHFIRGRWLPSATYYCPLPQLIFWIRHCLYRYTGYVTQHSCVFVFCYRNIYFIIWEGEIQYKKFFFL